MYVCIGDINLVNGRPWPFHKVEPRAYRLAILTAAVSRPFSIKFIAETADGTEQVTHVTQ
jgi:bilirubin oxidase